MTSAGRYFLAAITLAAVPTAAQAELACAVSRVELRDAFEGRQLLGSVAGRDVTREDPDKLRQSIGYVIQSICIACGTLLS